MKEVERAESSSRDELGNPDRPNGCGGKYWGRFAGGRAVAGLEPRGWDGAWGERWKAFLILDLGRQFRNFQPCILLVSSLDAHRGVESGALVGLPSLPWAE